MTNDERLEEIVQRVIVYRRAMVGAFDNSDQPGTYTADVSWLLSVIAERDAEIARLRESFADELQAMVASDQAEIAKQALK